MYICILFIHVFYSSDELEKLMNIQDLNQLKSEAKELLEKSVDQENRLKKLEFELEVEKGHVKILKHDNKALKQIAVEMVTIRYRNNRILMG